MRIKRALAIGATLVALTGAAGCGGDDGDGKSAGGGDKSSASADSTGQTTGSGLPKASDMASIAYYLNKYTPCLDLATGSDYDANHDADNSAWGADEAADPSWGIKERGVCRDESRHPIALLSVQDMEKFQTAVKKDGSEFLVGQDFAVVPVGDTARQALQKSGLKFLTCDADFSVPSGFTKEPAAVDGCVLSDYFPG
ncbi:hypothetical protein SAMN04487983_100737 [Streptomyces sp. yr375]|uniref:hypothetical protein n=1 Tax=Streptomyces sp. yr375 TaxID=1761906 RepID=UPI0008CE3025|nr:hypothetical protein [Streptomyces sp. yr375]SEQ67010.1 hypothetical protein SAMN04487983_100737 [Streptomyces sp. yr375]